MIELKRIRNWRQALSEIIEARRRVPFSDENNCAMFLADCVLAMTGVDLAADYRGKFSTVEEGMVLMRRDGFTDMGAFLAKTLEERHPAFAAVGDITLIDEWTGGVIVGDRITVMMPEGLGTLPRDFGKRAFRV